MTQSQAGPKTALRIVHVYSLVSIFVFRFSCMGLGLVASLFPAIFATGYASKLSLSEVFVPATPAQIKGETPFAAGVLFFLHWDRIIGMAAIVAWASIMLASASRKTAAGQSWLSILLGAVALTMLLGPGVCAVVLMWARDEIALTGTTKKKEAYAKLQGEMSTE